MSKKNKIIEMQQEAKVEQPTQEQVMEALKKIEYKPSALVWVNFNVRQPDPDRYFYLYCPMGKIAQNIYACYRDALGNYELPHPTKRYNAQAWAYADNPEIVTPVETVQ